MITINKEKHYSSVPTEETSSDNRKKVSILNIKYKTEKDLNIKMILERR